MYDARLDDVHLEHHSKVINIKQGPVIRPFSIFVNSLVILYILNSAQLQSNVWVQLPATVALRRKSSQLHRYEAYSVGYLAGQRKRLVSQHEASSPDVQFRVVSTRRNL